jgi:hypothetical protein
MTRTLRVLVPALVLTAVAVSGCYVTSTPAAVVSPRPEYGRIPGRHDDWRRGPYERRPGPDGGQITGHWEAGGRVVVGGHWQ